MWLHRPHNTAYQLMRQQVAAPAGVLQAFVARVHNFAIGQQVQQRLIGHFYLQRKIMIAGLLQHTGVVGFPVKFELRGEYPFHNNSLKIE